jgi:hypothetical protein
MTTILEIILALIPIILIFVGIPFGLISLGGYLMWRSRLIGRVCGALLILLGSGLAWASYQFMFLKGH